MSYLKSLCLTIVLYFLQATAVWMSKEVPQAKQYKSSELVSELSLKLHDFILHRTGDPRYQADPLLGLQGSLMRGEVVEYFSPEMGLVKLDTGRTVLFHLNQVWTGGEDAVPLAGIINRLLSDCLPVGSPVMVNMRPIPARQYFNNNSI